MTTSPITAFQADVARVFFSLPETKSFLLAGGLALAAHGISERPTEDLDAFTSKALDVTTAFEAFSAAAGDQGWSIRVVQASDTFIRLEVVGEDSLLVDLALDSAPGLPPVMSIRDPRSRRRTSRGANSLHYSIAPCPVISSMSIGSLSGGSPTA